MHRTSIFRPRRLRPATALAVLGGLLAIALGRGAVGSVSAAVVPAAPPSATPTFTWATAHDVSPPLRDLARSRIAPDARRSRRTSPTWARPPEPTAATRATVPCSRCCRRATIPRRSELRRAEQPGQLRHLRLPRESARPGRRRRPEPLRRDGQPRLRRLRQDRQRAARAGRHRHALERASPSPTAPTRRATRSSSTTRSPTAGSSRSSRRAARRPEQAVLELRRHLDDRRPDRDATTGTPSRRRTSSSSRTIRSTASGRTRTSSRRASSARRSSTGSACTRSRRTRW